MQCCMTILTQSDEVVWSIATSLSSLKMMNMKLDTFTVCATMLANIVVTLEDVLTDIRRTFPRVDNPYLPAEASLPALP